MIDIWQKVVRIHASKNDVDLIEKIIKNVKVNYSKETDYCYRIFESNNVKMENFIATLYSRRDEFKRIVLTYTDR